MSSKRFDNWDEVDCNECANYWTNSCDGVPEGQKRACNSFLAQRNVTIPAEIKSLRNELKSLKTAYEITIGILVLNLIALAFNLW